MDIPKTENIFSLDVRAACPNTSFAFDAAYAVDDDGNADASCCRKNFSKKLIFFLDFDFC